jgi:hypothetical protein
MAKRVDETREHSFDELARGTADGTLSRSRALKVGGTALLGGVLSLFTLPSRDAEAAKRRLLKSLWAVVNPDGTLRRGKGVVSSGKTGTGAYSVTFNRNITTCAVVATISDGFVGEISTVIADPPLTSSRVDVSTRDSAGNVQDKTFHLVVSC